MTATGSPIRGSPRRSTIKLYGRRMSPFETVIPRAHVADETLLHPSDLEDTYSRTVETVDRPVAQLLATLPRPFGFDELVDHLWGEYDRKRRVSAARAEIADAVKQRRLTRQRAETLYNRQAVISSRDEFWEVVTKAVGDEIARQDREHELRLAKAESDASRKFWDDVRAGVYGEQWSLKLAAEHARALKRDDQLRRRERLARAVEAEEKGAPCLKRPKSS